MKTNVLKLDAGRIAAASFVVAIGIAVACADFTSSPAPGDDAAMTQARHDSATPQARLDRTNPYSWVGKAHNQTIDDFRREIAKPGTLSSNLCSYMLDLLTQPGRLGRSGGPARAKADRSAAAAGAAAIGVCRGAPAAARNTHRVTGPVPVAFQEAYPISSVASDLLARIPTEVENAADAADLAARLLPILNASASLDETEYAIVGATISTAQYSYEYWSTELIPLENELWAEYSSCASATHDAGYDADAARVHCMESDVRATRTLDVLATPRVRFAAVAPPPVCGLRRNFLKLAGADAVGAAVGAVKGGVAGPPGAAVGAFSGGAYASLGQFLKSTWDLFWCAMD